jgi:hypothetical protein
MSIKERTSHRASSHVLDATMPVGGKECIPFLMDVCLFEQGLDWLEHGHYLAVVSMDGRAIQTLTVLPNMLAPESESSTQLAQQVLRQCARHIGLVQEDQEEEEVIETQQETNEKVW